MSYSNSPASERPPGRPRDPRREAAILGTVARLLGEVGYDGVTFELVAREAGASKPTLYRRWSTKRDMVVAAIRAMPATGGGRTIDTGSLRTDLLELAAILAETLAASDIGLVATLLQAGLSDPELCDHMETATGPTGARLPRDVLDRAIDRGEAAPLADAFVYDEVVASAMVTRRLNGLPCGQDYREQLVDAVLLPALRVSAPPVVHAGIFSGTHE